MTCNPGCPASPRWPPRATQSSGQPRGGSWPGAEAGRGDLARCPAGEVTQPECRQTLQQQSLPQASQELRPVPLWLEKVTMACGVGANIQMLWTTLSQLHHRKMKSHFPFGKDWKCAHGGLILPGCATTLGSLSPSWECWDRGFPGRLPGGSGTPTRAGWLLSGLVVSGPRGRAAPRATWVGSVRDTAG